MKPLPGVGSSAPSSAGPENPHAKLRRLSKELEGVFVQQLFSAMRDATPKNDLMGESEGEKMFTSMLDDAMASQASQRFDRGLGEALYRQLSRSLPPEPNEPQKP
jgi:Rod binding domain-containing protein